jgi:hypothetical protein
VGWFYFRRNEETARQAKVLTRDEARRMAVNFAQVPGRDCGLDPRWPPPAMTPAHCKRILDNATLSTLSGTPS